MAKTKLRKLTACKSPGTVEISNARVKLTVTEDVTGAEKTTITGVIQSISFQAAGKLVTVSIPDDGVKCKFEAANSARLQYTGLEKELEDLSTEDRVKIYQQLSKWRNGKPQPPPQAASTGNAVPTTTRTGEARS